MAKHDHATTKMILTGRRPADGVITVALHRHEIRAIVGILVPRDVGVLPRCAARRRRLCRGLASRRGKKRSAGNPSPTPSVILAGWVNRQQQEVIEYLRTENQVLREKLGKKRIILNDDQRRRLAVKGMVLGRKRMLKVGTLFTPDTTKGGLVTFYLLFVMKLTTRRVHFAGCTPNPNEAWTKQVARELTTFEDGFLLGKQYILMDRDGKFCPAFRGLLDGEGVEPVLLPPRGPNLNAHLERYMRSAKSECLDRMIFVGENSLRRAVVSYLEHYHAERNHQGLDGPIVEPGEEVGQIAGKIERRERLGGMLRYYHRAAARGRRLELLHSNDIAVKAVRA